MKLRSPIPISVIQHRGRSFPLGATLCCGGANFSVFAKHSSAAQLLLFDCVDDPEPSRVIDLDPHTNRTYHYWHTFVRGVAAGQLYGYCVSGPFDTSAETGSKRRRLRKPACSATSVIGRPVKSSSRLARCKGSRRYEPSGPNSTGSGSRDQEHATNATRCPLAEERPATTSLVVLSRVDADGVHLRQTIGNSRRTST
jgi:hypothetical protein